MKDVVRIGCASGFWGDTPEGVRQLVAEGGLDYLVLDYLAEVTMSILARMRARDPSQGYVPDFVAQVVRPHAAAIARQGLKVVVNAGGVHPEACKLAVERELAAQGLSLRVAAVLGDDLLAQADALRERGVRGMGSGAPLPARLLSANAYLGAFPIARALAEGAEIVITGRCVDSALALGPLVHVFGWAADAHDLLSAGSLAGHVIECGPQCTGGFRSDWRALAAGWATIGFPVVECHADGSFIVTKPAGTGGEVSVGSVSEQIGYETDDPSCYRLPDVFCDWSQVQVRQLGPDRVQVSGARGRAPDGRCKVSATYADGYRCIATLLVRGREAADKARAVGAMVLQRGAAALAREGLAPFGETSLELLGAEDAYGPQARAAQTREVVLKVAARHPQAAALELLAREVFPAATGTVQGIAGAHGGRPKVQPVVRLYSFLHPLTEVPVELLVDGRRIALGPPPGPAAAADAVAQAGRPAGAGDPPPQAAEELPAPPLRSVPLDSLAYARSGDKGDTANIVVLARRPEALPLLQAQLTAERVAQWFAHLVQGPVTRHPWPGLQGFNFVLQQALGGGGIASLRYDPQGKAYAEMLLDMTVQVPADWPT